MTFYNHFLISFLAGSFYLFLTGKPIDTYHLLPWFIGGVLIDIDHIFTYLATKPQRFNWKKIIHLIKVDYKQDNQHFYIFHTVEFAIFLAIAIYKTSLTWQYLAAYLLHLLCDGLRHQYLKKDFSWLKQWSFYLNFLK